MAIDTTNIQAAIAAKIAAEDSAVTALELLQYGVALSEYGAAQYYTSADSLPTADNDLKGMIALVRSGDPTTGNGLYLCTGTEWFEMQDLDSAAPYSFQGSNFGYVSGGFVTTPSAGAVNTIEKFSFTSDGNASDIADLSSDRQSSAGQSSSTHGYTSGGQNPILGEVTTIDKFPFSTDTNATNVADISIARNWCEGQNSSENGYTSGGSSPFPINPATYSNVIDKFPFASDANASDVGDLSGIKYKTAGQSSSENGYVSGGSQGGPSTNVIDKFPFASDANAIDIADLSVGRYAPFGQSSTVSGYASGGVSGGPPFITQNVIDKFPFASDTNASDVGDLTVARGHGAAQSSTVSGYTSGGMSPFSNVIDKFPFTSDTNASDVGDLTRAITNKPAGQQY